MWDELEYIELRNTTGDTIEIGDWTVTAGGDVEIVIDSPALIAPGGFYLVIDDGAVSDTPTVPYEIDAMTFLQGGETVQLLAVDGTPIDTANGDFAWFAGQNTSEGVAMSRKNVPGDGTQAANWADDLGQVNGRNGSPGEANIFSTGGASQPVGDIVINEIMWDELEYIELHNHTDTPVDIADWQIVVGGDVEFTIQAGATIAAGGFYLIADAGAVSFTPDQEATMTLLQGGELVQLKHFNGTVIDTANQAGAWFAGQNTSEGIAMSRLDPVASGTESSNWADDLGHLGGRNGSPGQANVFTEDTSMIGQVVINEIMWDELEYIELANISDTDISIADWQVLGDGSTEFTITSGATIPAGGFYLIAESGAVTVTPDQEVTMTLLQGGELMTLVNATGLVIDTANQSGAWFAGQNTSEGIAMGRIDSTTNGILSTNWADDLGNIGGRNGSPGQANIFDAGGGGGPTLSDTEQIIAVFDSWVVAFETADSELLRQVYSPSSAFIQMFNANSEGMINEMRADTVVYQIDSIEAFVVGEMGYAIVRGGVTVNGVVREQGKTERFRFRKENGIWRLLET